MSNTTYTIVLDTVAVDFTRSTKQTVINEANRLIKSKAGYKAEVVTSGGKVVHTVSRRKITKFTPAYTKTVELAPELAAAVPEGYAAAYERLRNGAVVLRRENDIPEDPSRYAVLNTLTKVIEDYAATTRDAGQIMKAMGKARKTAAA